jgi:8-amino-7-oxononanoate synthase
MTAMKAHWTHRLSQLQHTHLARTLRISGVGPEADTPEGCKLIFCTNDYLGLSASPSIARAAAVEMENGIGAGASRLVSGNFPWHETLERRFADFVGKSHSVLFPSGYQANVGAISALAGQGDVIFSDQLCHASIIDGCRLSRAKIEIYDHNDANHLKSLLAQYPNPESGKLVITEGIFSMDGDIPPLAQICDVAKQAGAAVYLDEAHSLGILGPEGRGLAAALNLEDRIDVLVGTFGKAVGVAGACVACESEPAQLLKSTARSLMYTTASPPALARAVCESLTCIAGATRERNQLHTNIRRFQKLAQAAQIPLLPSDTPIQPVLIGNAERTMAISDALWQRGIFVQGIRPPTVPAGTERLRITLSALHTGEQLERLIEELKNSGVGS